MVIPNFFITFVRHSFHTSHPLHIPSRERRHRPAPPCHQAPHSPHGTRAASRIKRTRLPHALHLARAMPHAPHTRYASSPSQHTRPPRYHPLARLCHTRYAHTTHPRPHSTRVLRATTPRKGLCHTRHARATHSRPHSTLALRATTPRKGLRHAVLPPSMKATLLHAPTPPQVFCEESASPITTKILHITILHVTFTRIGVKTTQKSEAIFSFID